MQHTGDIELTPTELQNGFYVLCGKFFFSLLLFGCLAVCLFNLFVSLFDLFVHSFILTTKGNRTFTCRLLQYKTARSFEIVLRKRALFKRKIWSEYKNGE